MAKANKAVKEPAMDSKEAIRASLVRIIMKATISPKPKKSKTPQVTRIQAALKMCDFGCRTADIARVLAATVGCTPEELRPKYTNGGTFRKGMAIVPLQNHGAHSYELKKTIMCVDAGERYFVRSDNTTGNHMDEEQRSWRLATADEIKAFTAKASLVQLVQLHTRFESLS
jgi:hypothetical protein